MLAMLRLGSASTLVLASELINSFGPRVAKEPECVRALDVVEAYCNFVANPGSAASSGTTDLAGIMITQCTVYRARVAFNAQFTG